jgi:hypothetical protein
MIPVGAERRRFRVASILAFARTASFGCAVSPENIVEIRRSRAIGFDVSCLMPQMILRPRVDQNPIRFLSFLVQ